ncbi:3',5'-cyclic adenosine monophosphate phosphodiesterase CpdA [Comamonas phosphati]|nr:3',5'-cyclic adenosine monophosphate phosphodiesterase CpdA [Comamonas phosphati]
MTSTFLLQITDLHIREPGRLTYRRIDTAHYLKSTVQSILRLPQKPHALVITGDLTDFGRPEEYAHLHELLSPLNGLPIYLLPGNHDERQGLRTAFPGHRYLPADSEFLQYAVDVGRLRLIAVDTVTPGKSEGGLCTKRLDWLQAQLAASGERPVVIAMHHPPFRTLIGHMDRIGLLQGAQELEALVRRHPNVERVICGHLHRSIQVSFGGTVAMTSPAPAHQVCLDLSPDAFAGWTLEPAAFMLHALPEQGRLISHTVASGDFDGPHPFWDAHGRLID